MHAFEPEAVSGVASRSSVLFAFIYVDKILKFAKPAELPVQQPKKFELVKNVKTAKALRTKVSNSILLRAAKLIE